MTRSWCSDDCAVSRLPGLLILAAGLLAATAAQTHPDLLEQIQRLDAQIRAQPDRADLLIRRGDLHRRHEDFAAAGRDFEAARALAPADPELDFHQGRLALEAGDPAAAGHYLDGYLAARPQDAVAWRLRAETALRRGEDSAAAGFERAVRFSESPSPALYRQWVLSLLAEDDRPAALAAVDGGLDRFGAEVSLLGLGADTALAGLDAARARFYLERLTPGLRRISPWAERLAEARCLETGHGAGSADQIDCAASAVQRLDAQIRTLRSAEPANR